MKYGKYSFIFKACRAFEKNFEHYISYDNNSKICYISQSTPSDSEVFSLVRKACLRTLHCEVFEDPIYFDDDKNGSVIGYEFHIKDSKGRGFQRSYSLLIVMKDRIYLQHLWSFLQNEMSNICNKIKAAAQKVYDNETRDNLNHTLNHHLKSNTSSTGSVFKKSPNRSNRGLMELTNDSLIFAKLHMWLTWILRASAYQITEDFLHGPVMEDLQVKLEKINNEYEIADKKMLKDLQDKNMVAEDIFLRFGTYEELIEIVGFEIFHLLAYNVIVGNQVIVRCNNSSLTESILQLLEVRPYNYDN